MRLLYRRDHSVKELTEKLSRWYEKSAVQEALEKVDSYGYLQQPEVLAEKFTSSLHRKNKGALKIAQELKKKGLTPLPTDEEKELEKGRALIDKLLGMKENLGLKEKQKAYRHLVNRGFDHSTIQKVLKEVFK